MCGPLRLTRPASARRHPGGRGRFVAVPDPYRARTGNGRFYCLAGGMGRISSPFLLVTDVLKGTHNPLVWVRAPPAPLQRLFLPTLGCQVGAYSALITARSSGSATSAWTRPLVMYLSCVIDTWLCPGWSAPTRADRPPASIR